MNNKLYVVTTHFNPHRFASRSRLYRDFLMHMKAAGVEVLTVEAAFGDHPFEVTSADNQWNVQLRTNCVLWHKERMGNLGFQNLYRLVPDSKYVGFFDADVSFSNPRWAELTVHKLMHHPVVQPFGVAINLDHKEEPMWNCPSSFRAFKEQRGYHQEPELPYSYTFKGHPGLAWAFTREALDALGGLHESCIAGSGDTVMSNCLKGDWSAFLPAPPSAGMTASMKTWAARCDQHIKTNVGHVPGTILHHWHGKSESRGYEKRWSILSFHQFDPTTDLVQDSQGLYRWAGNKPRLEDDIRLSLSARDEDCL